MSGLTVLIDTEIVRVGDVAEQVRGVSYSKEDVRTVPQPGYIPLLRGGNVREHGLAFDDLQFVPNDGVSQKQILRAGDILVVASSGSLSGVGKAACVPSRFHGTFGAFCKVIRPTDKIDAKYLGHYFRTADYRSKVSSLAGGANINNLRNEHLDGLKIRVPALDEQRRIVAVLDKADELRAKRREVLAKLDTLTQSVFNELFGNALASASTVVAEAGRVQLGRQRAPKYQTGKHTRPYMRVANVQLDRIDTSDVLTMDFDEKDLVSYRLSPGDILLNEGQSTELVGRPAMWRGEIEDCCFQNTLLRFTCNDRTLPEYALGVFLSYFRNGSFSRVSSKTSSVAHLGAGRFADMPFPIPDLGLQRKYAARVKVVDILKQQSRAQLIELDALFASLQHRAFRGEL